MIWVFASTKIYITRGALNFMIGFNLFIFRSLINRFLCNFLLFLSLLCQLRMIIAYQEFFLHCYLLLAIIFGSYYYIDIAKNQV